MGYNAGAEMIYMYAVFNFVMDVAKLAIGIAIGGALARWLYNRKRN